MLDSMFFTQMHKKAFGDWATGSTIPSWTGERPRRTRTGRQRRDKKGVVRDRIYHLPYQQFLDPPLIGTS